MPMNRLPAFLRNRGRLLGRSLLVAFLLGAIGLGGFVAWSHLWGAHRLREARHELGRRHLTRAREHLEFALRVWPRDAEVRLLAARAARCAGRFDEAEEHLKACRQAAGDTEDLHLERAMLRAHRGQMDPSLDEYLHTAIRNGHPDTPFILEALGHAYFRIFRYAQAFLCFEVWQHRQPDVAEPWLQLGLLWERKEQLDDAEKCCRRAVELDPDHFEARARLAEFQFVNGKAAEAADHYQRLHDLEPQHTGVLLGLARARLSLGQIDAGRQALDRLLALEPQNAAALVERGRVALQANQLSEAEESLRRAVALDPLDGQACYQLSLCRKAQGHEQEAQEYLAKSKVLEGAMRRLHDARLKLSQAPEDPAPRCEMGLVMLEIGMEEDGLRWLGSALREDPNHSPTHQALARYYEQHGDAGRAAYHRQRAGPRRVTETAATPAR
jgi:tetratricopeptide (TPR) repeat protein